jgi:hypothetical protein
MALRNATVTINTIGAAAGPFTVTDSVGQTYTNVSKASLLAGYTNIFDDTAAAITVTSTGVCTNNLVIPIVLPSPTPTPTPSPAPFVGVVVKLSNATNTICSAGNLLRFTNDGTVITGNELRLSNGNPVTGFTFVVDAGGGIIYELDPVTGLIGADSGFAC